MSTTTPTEGKDLLPNLDESSKNWGKVKDKDKWLDDVRGKEVSAMQELITELERRMYIIQSETTELREQMIVDLVKDLDDYLAKEREQIAEAFTAGLQDWLADPPNEKYNCGIDYFNSKYNQ